MDFDYTTATSMLAEFSNASSASDAANRKRERLLEAATALFIQHGYRKTSIDDVARAAGVAKGTVYLYFKTKAELLLQAIIEEKKQYLSQAMPVFDTALPPKERLRNLIQLAVELGNKMPLTSKLLSGDYEIRYVLEEMDSNLREDIQGMQITIISELLKKAFAPGEIDESLLHERAHVLGSLLYSGVFFGDLIVRRLPIERFAAVLADMLVDGILHIPTGDS